MSAPATTAGLGAVETPAGFSGEEYNHVARTAELGGIRLLKFAMEGRPDLYSRDTKQTLSYDRQLISCHFDEEARAVAAIFRFSVAAKTGRAKSFSCQADYAVIYQMAEDAKREAALAFCKHVGAFAGYPYFRAAVSQMAWSSEIDLPPLPSIAAMPVVPRKAAKPEAAR